MARFLLRILDGENGQIIATREVDASSCSEAMGQFLELAAPFAKPTFGNGFPVDEAAERMVAAALDALPQVTQDALAKGSGWKAGVPAVIEWTPNQLQQRTQAARR